MPYIIDQNKSLSIKALKDAGLFDSNNLRATLSGFNSEAMQIDVNTDKSLLEVFYTLNNKPKSIKIKLEKTQSNLGFGFYFYFVCPYTGKRCRKLHFVNGVFCHYSNISNALYSLQTYSKKQRSQELLSRCFYGIDRLEKLTKSKYYKKTYNGINTKRHQKTIDKIKLYDYLLTYCVR